MRGRVSVAMKSFLGFRRFAELAHVMLLCGSAKVYALFY